MNSDSSVSFTTSDFDTSIAYTENFYNQKDSSTGNPWSGLFYEEVIQIGSTQHITKTFKDAEGRTAFTVYDDGSYTQTIYSNSDQAITALQLPAGVTIPTGLTIPLGGSETVNIAQRKAGDSPVATFNVYDVSGNLTDVYQPVNAVGASASFAHWQYGYDQYGNEITQLDPNIHLTKFSYDAMGRKISQTLQNGEKQTWTFDAFGNSILHTSYDSTGAAVGTTWDIYDTFSSTHGGRLAAEYRYTGSFVPSTSASTLAAVLSYAESSSYAEKTTYVYDDATGSSFTAASGITVPTSQQTGLGRVIEVDDYSSKGLSSPSTYTSTTYDPVSGQQASITTPQGTISYRYNEATGQLSETITNLNDESYQYYPNGQLKEIDTLKLNGSTYGGVPTTKYAYDAFGNLYTVTDQNGMVVTYLYDDLNRLTNENVVNSSGSSLFSQTYTYYDNGLKKSDVETHTSSSSFTLEYDWQYDAAGRLTEEQLKIDSGTSAITPYTDDFKYDGGNNRTEEDITGGSTGNGTILYGYNGDDELKTETGTYTATANNYAVNYDYDGNGNLKDKTGTGSNPESDTYTYDLRNRMTTATVNGVATSYAYDTNSVIVTETTAGVTTTYLNDPLNLTGYTKAIQKTVSGGTTPGITSYVLGMKVEAQSDPAGFIYLLTDGHGSTRAIVNASGALVQNYDYDAFNAPLDFTAASARTTWLGGGDGWYDSASNLTDQLARWRNGFWFTQSDPSLSFEPGDLFNANLHIYAGGNPVSFGDPTGRLLDELLSVLGSYASDFATQVGEAVTVYNEASTLKSAADLAEQYVTTGTVNPIVAAALLTQFLPFGKLLGGLAKNLVEDTLTGVSDSLQSVFNNITKFEGPVGKAAQWVGEMGAGLVAKAKGFIPTNFPASYHGLDQVFQDGEKLIIVEAKGGAGTLAETAAGGQMSQSWIENKIGKLLESNDPLERNWGQKLLDAKNSGNLQGMVVSTPINGAAGTVGDPTFILKDWSNIGSSNF